jgi:SAM-dependent methyltransferase
MDEDFDLVKDFLCSPINGTELRVIQNGKNENIFIDSNNNIYPIINNQPILINFEQSIIDKDYLLGTDGKEQVVRKKNKPRDWIKDNLLRPNAHRLSVSNAKLFIESLKKNKKTPIVLVIGGGTMGMGTELLYEDQDITILNCDIYPSDKTHFVADAHHLPIKDQVIDGVWIQYVLEHVLDPKQVVSEIHRILSKDGLVYSETPFMQQVHEGPYDFTRFTHSGHRWLFKNFTEVGSGIAMGSGVQLLWTIENVFRGIFRSRKIGQAFKILFFPFRLLEKIIPENFRYDTASSFFFLGKKANNSILPKSIINYYRGGL